MASISKEELETIAAILVNRTPEETERIRAEELKTTVASIRNQERNEGYYSVNEAVALLLAETGEYFRIGKATWDGDLESYAPNSGKKIVTKGNIPSDWTHYDEAAEVRWDNLNVWLEKHTRVQYRFPNPSAAPETKAAPVLPTGASDGDGKSWIAKARERAPEIINRQRAKDLYPNQNHIGDEIAKEFRLANVMGANGKPLSGATIKRHALHGISSARGKQLSTTIRRGK